MATTVTLVSPLATNAWAPSALVSPSSSSLKLQQQKQYSGGRFYNGPLYATIEEPVTADDSSSVEDDFLQPKSKILGQPIPYSELTLGVLAETFPGENRVSQTPDSIRSLVKGGMNVIVQQGGKCINVV